MKLATYQDGSRDGQLIVVSRDLSQAHFANGIASRLQQVLDDWNFLSPQLEDLSLSLNQGKLRHAFSFDPRLCMAPLPRAYQRLQAQAYATHRERLGLDPQQELLLQQLCCDELFGATAPLRILAEAQGADVGPGLVAITGDVPQGVSPEQALEGVRLLALCNQWQLRALDAGQVWAQVAAAFAPVAVTPDELAAHGASWSRGRVGLQLQLMVNGRKFGQCDTAAGMDSGFGELIAQAARGRRLRAGTLMGAGTAAANPETAADAKAALQSALCLWDRRALEMASSKQGEPKTGYLKFGDSVLIDAKGPDAQSVFGAIDQDLLSLSDDPAHGDSVRDRLEATETDVDMA